MLWPREPWATSLASSAEYYLRHGYRSTIITVPVPPPRPGAPRPGAEGPGVGGTETPAPATARQRPRQQKRRGARCSHRHWGVRQAQAGRGLKQDSGPMWLNKTSARYSFAYC